jgi:selenium metabolism protein YedF
MEKIDARGMACPEPVVMTKKALDGGASELQVLVDNEVARDNVSRLGKKMGCAIETSQSEQDFLIRLCRSDVIEQDTVRKAQQASLIFVNSNAVGKGSDELGEALLKTFLNTLAESHNKPDKLVFMNSGVKMVAEDSGALESLKSLEDQGVEIIACGTCLDYFNLKDKIAVGKISNMYDILDSMLEADKMVTI